MWINAPCLYIMKGNFFWSLALLCFYRECEPSSFCPLREEKNNLPVCETFSLMLTCQHAVRVKRLCCVSLLGLPWHWCVFANHLLWSFQIPGFGSLTLVLFHSGLPFSAIEASCNFERDLCNFYQDKEGPGWTRVKVKPNMYRAGDHTSGIGNSWVCPCGNVTGGRGYISWSTCHSYPTLPKTLT